MFPLKKENNREKDGNGGRYDEQLPMIRRTGQPQKKRKTLGYDQCPQPKIKSSHFLSLVSLFVTLFETCAGLHQFQI